MLGLLKQTLLTQLLLQASSDIPQRRTKRLEDEKKKKKRIHSFLKTKYDCVSPNFEQLYGPDVAWIMREC